MAIATALGVNVGDAVPKEHTKEVVLNEYWFWLKCKST